MDEQVIANLREKIRQHRQECRRSVNKLDGRVTVLEARAAQQENALAALEQRLEELFAEPDDPAQGGMPPTVNSLESLRAFIIAVFGEEWAHEYKTPDMKEACRLIRDSLAENYEDIQRINDQPTHPDYPNVPETKHADAVLVRDASDVWLAVDFCRGSSDPGVIWDELQWHVYPPESA